MKLITLVTLTLLLANLSYAQGGISARTMEISRRASAFQQQLMTVKTVDEAKALAAKESARAAAAEQSLTTEIGKLEQTRSALQAQVNDLTKRAADLSAKEAQASSNLETLRTSTETLQARNDALTRTNGELSTKNTELTQASKHLGEDNARLTGDIEKLKQYYATLDTDKKTLIEQITKLKADLEGLENSKKAAEAQLAETERKKNQAENGVIGLILTNAAVIAGLILQFKRGKLDDQKTQLEMAKLNAEIGATKAGRAG